MPNLRHGSKAGFERGLTRLRVRHSTTELARSTREFRLLAKSNAMRKSAQEKHTELDLVTQKIDTAVAALEGI